MNDWNAKREKMVQRQLVGRGIRDERLLDAMRLVPRHLFVPAAARADACEDRPLPIGAGQTIAQPYMVAYMTEALELSGKEKVLEVGAGSGYQTAVLAMLAGQVYSAELVPDFARKARRRLKTLQLRNAQLSVADGLEGWLEQAPFDRILLTAAVEQVPMDLAGQLKKNGWLIAPIGRPEAQKLCRMERGPGGQGWTTTELLPVAFVQARQGGPS